MRLGIHALIQGSLHAYFDSDNVCMHCVLLKAPICVLPSAPVLDADGELRGYVSRVACCDHLVCHKGCYIVAVAPADCSLC